MYEGLSTSRLMKSVMAKEILLERWLHRDRYLGKNSRVQALHDECNALWIELEARGRAKPSPVLTLVPYGQQAS